MSSQREGNSSVPVVAAGARVSRSKRSNQKSFLSFTTRLHKTKTNLRYIGKLGGCGGGIQKKRKISRNIFSVLSVCAMVLGGMGRDKWMGSVFFFSATAVSLASCMVGWKC